MPEVDIAEPGIITAEAQTDADLPRLIQFYEASEETSKAAREKAERDRDYVDNKQLTQEEVAKLQKRGQPPIALNVIRSRASFLAGMEKKQRRDPKAWPRNNPNDLRAAEAFTDGMRYVVDRADYASSRSQAWKNITVEGFGGIEVAAVPKKNGDVEITIHRIPWDRLFYDPHSSEPDFSDSRYFGQVLWMDLDQAMARAISAGQVNEQRAKEIFETTLAGASTSGRTYDDKPRWQVWADGKRKRVRVVMIWHLESDGWRYCEFTQAGKFAWSDAPYVDQDGESYCPWLLESANVDRENNRYGEMRHLIDPQDEINNRRSKALHQANSRGVIASEGAVKDVNKTRRELAKTDFYIEIQPGAEKFEVVDGVQMTAAQVALYQEAMAYMREAGPNQALLGKGTQDQSGRAIEAQQAGGLVEQSDLMDTLRRLDKRVFTVIGWMMKQKWTAEKWIRVTDDDQAPQWVGLNIPRGAPVIDPMTGQPAIDPETGQPMEGEPQIDPETGQSLHGLHNNVAELDMDILVSDAPDTISLDGENFQAFMDLMKSGLPPQVLKFAIEMHPGLTAKRKKQLTDLLDEILKPKDQPPEAAEAQRLAKEKAEAEIGRIRAQTYRDLTTGESTMARIGAPASIPPKPDVLEGMGDESAERPMDDMPPQGPQGGPPMGPGSPGPQPMPMRRPGPPEGPPQGPPMAQPGPMVGMMSGRGMAA